ncbi:hypothetical protein ACFHYO_08265, partial [Paracoccus panacisoli]
MARLGTVILVIVLLLGGVWLWQSRETLMPGPAPVTSAPGPAPVTSAPTPAPSAAPAPAAPAEPTPAGEA